MRDAANNPSSSAEKVGAGGSAVARAGADREKIGGGGWSDRGQYTKTAAPLGPATNPAAAHHAATGVAGTDSRRAAGND
jgi:hypothetical protein